MKLVVAAFSALFAVGAAPMAPTVFAQADKAAAWERQLRDAIPDVKPGDRITGVHRPGQGASFLVNGKPYKAILDAEFARLFFGIWLADATSEPAMRRELLSLVKP